VRSSNAQSTSAPATVARPEHVFLIILENKGFAETFGPHSKAPYLSGALRKQGRLLTQYYATGHFSLDNYITLISGQAPNPETQADCIRLYSEFAALGAGLDHDGQIRGQGCVYPTIVPTLVDQLEQKHLTWRGYMEDMARPCEHPELNQPDDHVHAVAGDQYATRHNPFVYFHSIINDADRCRQHVVALTQLPADLSKVETTPNFAFITPNLCNDGHDGPSAICDGGGLVSADRFLAQWVPKIIAAPAYQRDGILIITFDEAEVGLRPNHQIDPATTDARSCCDEPPGPNTAKPGLVGPGGGRTGALMLSPLIAAGSIDETPYNHYSMLRGLEDLFGLDHLGYARKSAPTPLDQFLSRQ